MIQRRKDSSRTGGHLLAWLLAGSAVIANGAGYALDLYDKWWWFDRVLHGFTILALTYWLAIFHVLPLIQPRFSAGIGSILLIVSVGVAAGAVWEVVEWAFDYVSNEDVIKGKHDTILDIIMDTIGALAASALALLFDRGEPRGNAGEDRQRAVADDDNPRAKSVS
nr:hypothetical protein RNT25_04456 [arsenite-oxidising bacterium NT-25]